MECGFGKISLEGLFKAEWEFGTPLYGRFVYLRSGADEALICAFDLAGTFHTEVRRFISAVSARTGIPAGAIWYHELQIHATVGGDVICGEVMDKLIDRASEKIAAVKARACECECFSCDMDLGTEYTMNREQYIEGLGGVTVWRGLKFTPEGVPYTDDPRVMLLRGYQPPAELFKEKAYFDNEVDPKAYLFVFKDLSGRVLGSVSRFAAHPDVAVLFEHSENPDRLKEYRYDFDWPGRMCEKFEKEYGGTSVYLNGPCADLAVKKDCVNKGTYTSAAAECERIAGLLFDRMKSEFALRARRVETDKVFAAETFEFKLPVKDDFPRSFAEALDDKARIEAAQTALENAIDRGAPPYEIKRLIDERWRAGHFRSMVFCSGGYTEEELKMREVPVQVAALRFGGYLFVGLPGESLCETSLWLRSAFTGEKTVTVDQVDGYYNYLASPRTLTLGGYTYWASFVSRGAIPRLKRELYPALKKFMQTRPDCAEKTKKE